MPHSLKLEYLKQIKAQRDRRRAELEDLDRLITAIEAVELDLDPATAFQKLLNEIDGTRFKHKRVSAAMRELIKLLPSNELRTKELEILLRRGGCELGSRPDRNIKLAAAQMRGVKLDDDTIIFPRRHTA